MVIAEELGRPLLSVEEAGGRHRLALYFALSNQLAEYDGPHAWAAPLREAAVRWMVRWLRPGAEFVMCEDDFLPEKTAQVTETGQVLKLAGARNAYDLIREEAARLKTERQTEAQMVDVGSRVRRTAGIRKPEDIPLSAVREVSRRMHRAGEARRVVLQIQGGVPLPAAIFMPCRVDGLPVLIVDGVDKTNACQQAAECFEKGRPVMVMDISGTGETSGTRYGTWTSGISWDEGPAMMAYVMGRSLVGIRAEDILAGALWLANVCSAERTDLEASSWAVTPALHAAVSAPQLFVDVTITDLPDACVFTLYLQH
ncbi:MAG: hypothetical protein R6V06_03215 [Kiritimatiellia bacterium]